MNNDDARHHKPQPAPTLRCPSHCQCPHWDAPNRACLAVKNGLFLPVEQHVVSYCLSSHYAACPQYQVALAEETGAAGEALLAINRRRSVRIPSHHTFRFSEITANDHLPGLVDDGAWTVDLSDHGIRFASRHPLAPDTTIHFLVESDGTMAALEGTGRVIWSEPLENSPLFHSAIAFADRPEPAAAPSPPRHA